MRARASAWSKVMPCISKEQVEEENGGNGGFTLFAYDVKSICGRKVFTKANRGDLRLDVNLCSFLS